jgi:hypothetical protein
MSNPFVLRIIGEGRPNGEILIEPAKLGARKLETLEAQVRRARYLYLSDSVLGATCGVLSSVSACAMAAPHPFRNYCLAPMLRVTLAEPQ